MTNVIITTNHGALTATLHDEHVADTVANFLRYVDDGFYDGTIFHRVIRGFMIQGGGFTPDMQEKDGKYESIKHEGKKSAKNLRGTLAMARTNDPHSATSQFFINVVDNDFLDYGRSWGYVVFGEITDGMDVVDAIEKVKTTSHGHHDDVPMEAVVIEKIERV